MPSEWLVAFGELHYLESILDGLGNFLLPFWSDHKENLHIVQELVQQQAANHCTHIEMAY